MNLADLTQAISWHKHYTSYKLICTHPWELRKIPARCEDPGIDQRWRAMEEGRWWSWAAWHRLLSDEFHGILRGIEHEKWGFKMSISICIYYIIYYIYILCYILYIICYIIYYIIYYIYNIIIYIHIYYIIYCILYIILYIILYYYIYIILYIVYYVLYVI